MKRKPRSTGFSILEILIAVIIIGILALILIPALANRAEQARRAAVVKELEAIADAQERLAIDIGYYGRLFILDDLDGGNGQSLAGDLYDGILDEELNTAFYDNLDQLFIDPETGDFLTPAANSAILRQLDAGSITWQGPYYNIHRDETVDQHDTVSVPPHLHDIPNDPWGFDYLFFTRGGLVQEPDGRMIAAWETLYDRPTVVSTGPDGIFNTEDDFVRSFGY